MAKKRPANEVDPDLAAQFSVAPIGEAASDDSGDVLGQLLGNAPSADADDGVELDTGELGALQEEFDAVAALTLRKKQLEAELGEVSKALTAQKDRMLGAMTLQGTKQFSSALGPGACSRSERYDTTLSDVDAFIDWVKESHPELLTVNNQTRNRFIREQYRDQGIPEGDERFPPGITVTPREQLVVRGVKPPQGGPGNG